MTFERSPRSATHLVHHLESSPLMVAPDVTDAKGISAPQIPLSKFLWQETQQYQSQALQSGFVQGIWNATLNPEAFGSYMLQDSVFCYEATKNIMIAETKAKDPCLKMFLMKRLESYKDCYTHLFDTWRIETPPAIKLGNACKKYIDHEYNVAQILDTVYFVVALIPCSKLWPWIGEQIGATTNDFGVYTKWVNVNFSPDSSGVTKYETLINRDDALEVYTKSMMGEANFFDSIKTM